MHGAHGIGGRWGRLGGSGRFAFPAAWAALAAVLGFGIGQAPEAVLGLGLALAGLGLLLRIPETGLGLALLTGPFAPLENERWGPPVNSAQIFLALSLLAGLWRGLARREGRIPGWGWAWAYGLFLGYAFLTLAWAPSWEEGVPEGIKWAQVGLVVILVLGAPRPVQRFLLGMALLSGAVQAGIGLWQAALRGAGPAHFRLPGLPLYRAYGTFQQPNPFGGMMGLIAPVALGLGIGMLGSAKGSPSMGRWGAAVGALAVGGLAGAGLLASGSRGAWLGAAGAGAVLILLLPRRGRTGLAAGAALGLALGLLGSSGWIPPVLQARLAGVREELWVADVRGVEVNEANFAVIERLAHWQAAVEMIRAHPWFGVGLGNYAVVYPRYALIRWPHPLGHAHNIYLNMAAETGLAGLSLYLLFWAVVGVRTWRAWQGSAGWRRGLAAGLMAAWAHLHIHNLFDNLYVANLPLFLALYGAWVEILINERESPSPPDPGPSQGREDPPSLHDRGGTPWKEGFCSAPSSGDGIAPIAKRRSGS